MPRPAQRRNVDFRVVCALGRFVRRRPTILLPFLSLGCLSLVFLAGCRSPSAGANRTRQDPQISDDAMLSAVEAMTIGLECAAARQALESEGFDGFEEASAEGEERVLWCQRTDAVGFWVSRRWMVKLHLDREDRVSAVSLTSGYTGP